MDDQNPDPQLAQLDEQPPTTPPADEPAGDGPTRYAVYDKDELRFRGRTHDTRKAADDAKSELGKPKGVRPGRFEVREV